MERKSPLPLSTNKEGSIRRLAGLARKLEKTYPTNDYQVVIEEQLAEGIAEREPTAVQGRDFHISHKEVVRETTESTELTIVYDASARA